ncbi:PAS domain-containing protein [Gloeobacter morelensis]|uniref:histidine kinase n=1 Tax=Gloeobacter morelensis MG652769 TaxID=2781736 RepID=A0ABY3PP24_9CYAN|nr:PAS domain-containing protein [Gloeobacter morelensis]UFP95412.1 PAS domain-containing protein [Gloeobacter morelensis MG652769]
MDDWRFRFLLECVPHIVWTASPDGYLECCNQYCLEYTGLSLEQLQGCGWQHAVHPEDLPLLLRRSLQSLRSGEAYEVEYRLRCSADGAYRWHLGKAMPIHDGDGQVLRWFGTCTDVHSYKLAGQRES